MEFVQDPIGTTKDIFLKERFWQEIGLRLMRVSSGCTIPGQQLGWVSQIEPVPAKRPSYLVFSGFWNRP